MLVKKKLVLLLAMAAFVTACGGGGDNPAETTNNAGGGSQTGGTGSTPASDNGGNGNAPATGGTTTPPDDTGGNVTPPDDTGGSVTPPDDSGDNTATDQQLTGHLALVANQLVYIRTNRMMFHAITLTQFESDTGMYDAASGSATAITDVPAPTQAVAPAAPIAAFGLRIDKHVQASGEQQQLGNQTAVGRVAFSLTEREGTVGTGEAAESMRFVIDGVELSTDASGQVSARVRTGAQMHVYGRNAANEEVRATIAVPTDAVTLLPMSEVLDHYGDTSSIVLLMDLETAFSSAGQALAALENISGHFSMQVTLSPAQIVRPAEPDLEYKDLVGQPITVNDQPAVTGAGINGNVWIRMYPPESSGS